MTRIAQIDLVMVLLCAIKGITLRYGKRPGVLTAGSRTFDEEKESPGVTFLPPPKWPARQGNNCWFVPGTLIVLVVLIEIGTVSYTSSFKGAQEDIVAMYQAGSGISSENDTAVMLKLLISA